MGDTPVLIPNTAVKTHYGDNTGGKSLWKDSKTPDVCSRPLRKAKRAEGSLLWLDEKRWTKALGRFLENPYKGFLRFFNPPRQASLKTGALICGKSDKGKRNPL